MTTKVLLSDASDEFQIKDCEVARVGDLVMGKHWKRSCRLWFQLSMLIVNICLCN